MIQLTTACVSSVDEAKGNTSNLLFSGQILPERNGGLNGAPSVRLEPGATCVAAVFDGKGSAARKAAYLAAGAFRGAVGELHGVEDLEALYAKAHGDIAAAAAEEAAMNPVAALLTTFLPMILIFVVFYFFLIRPQRKKDKKVKEMLNNLKAGDRICTIGGIYGTIVGIKDDTVTLSVGRDNLSMVVARWGIRSVEEVTIENDAEALN